MNYELAKELAKAGFPVSKDLKEKFDRIQTVEPSGYIEAYYPTLEQLIMACGERFSGLTRSSRNTWYVHEVKPNSHVELVKDIECANPSEAVARLWLALNPIKQNSF